MAGRFHVQDEARSWLKNVTAPLHSEAEGFEVYYLCAMAGLAAERKSDVASALTSELVDNFPGEFSSRGRMIVGLFLSREMRFRKIGLEEKGPLHRAIREYVDPRSPSQLSEVGVKELNRYAFGGFEKIIEWFPDKPADLESFLPKFHALINEALAPAGEPGSIPARAAISE